MTNFMKNLSDGSSKKEGNCCEVEIKAAAPENKEGATEACCESCCSTETTSDSSSCCG
ncbi:hypothetical protein G3578_12070 [Brevibacillus sp. SYP-B805]|nr:hypothetical protein [Brevibacillus sp. SYP-B805]